MSIGLLDLHDTNLQLWHQDTRVQSPGYALLKGKEYLFGAPARAAAKLQPRAINTRYWWQLSTELLQPALGPARHTGDLVHAPRHDRRGVAREGLQPVHPGRAGLAEAQLDAGRGRRRSPPTHGRAPGPSSGRGRPRPA